jgi:hypothetical protein
VRDTIKNSSLCDYLDERLMFSTIHDAITYIDAGVNEHADAALQTNN